MRGNLLLAAALTFLAAAVLAPATGGREAAAQEASGGAPDSIRVVSAEGRVHFPEGMTFTLRAESDSPITAVSIHYSLGGLPYTVYGYPDFSPGNSVAASFTVRSDGARYLPSGLDINYHYLIENAAGDSLRTASRTLTYLDPGFRWQSTTVGSIEVLWHDRDRSAVEAAAAEVDSRVAEVMRVLGLDSAPVMRAVILNDRREATRSLAQVSRAATEGHLYAGFAYGQYDLFLLAGLDVSGMVHEMVHLLLDEALVSPLARVPAWFDEGLAMYFEPGSGGTDRSVLSAARAGTLLTLSSMQAQPGRPGDVRLFYAQARSLTAHIISEYGEDRLSDLIAAVGAGARFEDAAMSIYGLGTGELEAEWRESVGAVRDDPVPTAESERRSYEPSHRADPGTMGTSLLLALAASFAAAVTGGGWLLRRRRRAQRPETDEPEGFDPRYDTPP